MFESGAYALSIEDHSKIIDALEARGIIGPADGSRPRQVLLSEEEFRQMKENL